MNAGHARACWRGLTVAALSRIVGAGPPLLLAPHQDDESLGCGGLIAACVARGTPPIVAFLTDGSFSHPGSRTHPPSRMARLRAAEARTALAALGVARAAFLGARDGAAPISGVDFDAFVSALARLSRGCTAILAPWQGDPHCDHLAASRMAAEVARRTGLPLVSYPVWGWMLPSDAPVPRGPVQGRRLRVAAHLAAKRRAISAPGSQLGRVVHDDPAGFTLPRALITRLTGPYEVYLR